MSVFRPPIHYLKRNEQEFSFYLKNINKNRKNRKTYYSDDSQETKPNTCIEAIIKRALNLIKQWKPDTLKPIYISIKIFWKKRQYLTREIKDDIWSGFFHISTTKERCPYERDANQNPLKFVPKKCQ